MEMPPESTHPLADDGDRFGPFRSRPAPPHGDEAALARRSPAHRQESVHPQLSHRLLVERLHLDAQLFQRLDPIGELDRIEHVRRLVDQVARHLHAFGDGEAVLRGGARGDRMARADHKVGRFGVIVFRVLLARLVFVKPVAAKPKAKSEIGRRRAVPCSGRGLKRNFDPLRAGKLAESEAAERDKVDRRAVLARCDADNDEPRSVETRGRKDVERGALGARKLDALAAARINGSRSPNWAVTIGAAFMSAPTNTTSALPLGADRGPKATLTTPLMTNVLSWSGFRGLGLPA